MDRTSPDGERYARVTARLIALQSELWATPELAQEWVDALREADRAGFAAVGETGDMGTSTGAANVNREPYWEMWKARKYNEDLALQPTA